MFAKPWNPNPVNIKGKSESTVCSDSINGAGPDSFLPRLSYNMPVSICLLDKRTLVLNILCSLRVTSYLLSNGKVKKKKMLRILKSEFQLLSVDLKFAFPFIMLPTTER